MKKPNQIEGKNSRGNSVSQEKKPETKRVKVYMPPALKEAVQTAAKGRAQSVSQFVVEGIRKACAAGKQPESEIPDNWNEVAFIDFSGYLDRDCEERTIYKTPEGDLVASTSDQGKRFNEDVTREQVVRWLHEHVIPEEFEKDFAIRFTKITTASQNGVNPDAFAGQRVRDALEDATFRSAALLEALATLLEFTEKADHPQLSDSTVEGLRFIAFKEGVNLRDSFEIYCKHEVAKAS